jgi:hypothetical protein
VKIMKKIMAALLIVSLAYALTILPKQDGGESVSYVVDPGTGGGR